MKTLTFQVADMRPFRQGDQFKYGLISLDARVLGMARPAEKTP
jgi:hypothetical protein